MNRVLLPSIVVGILLLSACGAPPSPQPTEQPAPPPAPAAAPGPDWVPPPTSPTAFPPPNPSPAPEGAGFLEIRVTAKFATFNLSTITVAKGETVNLTVTSTDSSHTFTIDELGINIAVGSGQTATEEFTVEKAGIFTFYCAVPGHRDAGMEGTLEATE